MFLMAIPDPSHILLMIVPTKRSLGAWHWLWAINATGTFEMELKDVYWPGWARNLGWRVMENMTRQVIQVQTVNVPSMH